MLKLSLAVTGLVASAIPAYAQQTPPPAATQDAPPPADGAGDESDEAEIVVRGEVPGAVVGDVKPEIQLNSADIRAMGVNNLTELLAEIAPQTRSGRGGGPVILLNGRRISGFQEISTIPPEAIERVDILPEEVALKYGYRADQRVVNFVLRQRFRSIMVQGNAGMSTHGGAEKEGGEVQITKIRRDTRINVGVEYDQSQGLLESDRNITPTSQNFFDYTGNISLPGATTVLGGVPASAATTTPTLAGITATPRNFTDSAFARTLISPSQSLSLNTVYSRPLSKKINATINFKYDIAHRESLLGLPGLALNLPATNPFAPSGQNVVLSRYVAGQLPLSRDVETRNAHVGVSLNGDFSAKWRWSVTGNYDRANSRTVTDTGFDTTGMQALLNANSAAFNPYAAIPLTQLSYRPADRAETVSNTGAIDALVNGALFKLPAGDVSASLRTSLRTTDLSSDTLRNGIPGSTSISRQSENGQLNISLPIASRNKAVLGAIGDLSVNGTLEAEHFSDFGTLLSTGVGAVWTPLKQVRLIASLNNEENAPSPSQLGDAVLSTPNVRVFDYVRGETVDITAISGGNRNLSSETRHAFKLGLNVKPIDDKDLTFSVDYNHNVTRNQIASFPAATAAVEAAFPGRFTRDPTGRLTSIDNRPVNFDRADSEEVRWGFNFSAPLSSKLEKRFQEARAKRDAEREAARAEAERTGQPLPPEGPRRVGPDGQPLPPGGPGQGSPDGRPREQQSGFFGGGGGGFSGGGRGGRSGGFRSMGGPNGMLAGRINFSLYHTWHLKEDVVIRPGLPVIDLLNGGATGNSGGQSEHEIEAQGGISKDGLGFRFNAKWQSATTVKAGTTGSTQDLHFGSLGTLGFRFFADLGQQLNLVRKHRWLIGTRVMFGIDNILDTRQRVTDSNGVVPTSYQPDLLDPQGRTVKLTIRKMFF